MTNESAARVFWIGTLDSMSFDLANFEAEVALRLIPTERLPAIAQDALEDGFDGPNVLRMAILEPVAGWGIDQALQPMLTELGCQAISPKEAALRLAQIRARRILETGEDPLPSIPCFYRLMLAADYPEELIELGYFDDDDIFFSDVPEEKRMRAREALEVLLFPELRQKRLIERKVAWEREQARVKSEWPYVLNSPTGRALLKERYKEKLIEMRPLLWIELVAWIIFGWGISSWRTTVIGYILSVPVLFALPVWGEYRRMKCERRDTLLRRGVPDDQI
jgi:hypothetical protein